MANSDQSPPSNRQRRTRKDLLRAAARLLKQGRKPTLEEIAEEALVSRATAYRYFPGVEALHLEASLDVAVPDAEDLFPAGSSTDPVERLDRVETMFHDMILVNEAPLRMFLAHSLQRSVTGRDDGTPARQNRRSSLIEAALAPVEATFDPARLDTLRKALALIIGTEAMVVCKDVLQLDDADARRVKLWAIHALLSAARNADPESPVPSRTESKPADL